MSGFRRECSIGAASPLFSPGFFYRTLNGFGESHPIPKAGIGYFPRFAASSFCEAHSGDAIPTHDDSSDRAGGVARELHAGHEPRSGAELVFGDGAERDLAVVRVVGDQLAILEHECVLRFQFLAPVSPRVFRQILGVEWGGRYAFAVERTIRRGELDSRDGELHFGL